jgi:DNA-binding IscR family transcriptional regulator
MQIARLTEGLEFTEGCVLGLKVCSDKTACPMHTKWWPIKQEIVRLLQNQTLEMLAAMVASGKYQLTDFPGTVLGDLKLPA